MQWKCVTAQRSKKMKNVSEVECQTAESPGSRDDEATQGKARAQVPQVPADDQKSPMDQQWLIQIDQSSVHHPEDSLAEPPITISIPSPVKTIRRDEILKSTASDPSIYQ